MSILFLTMDGVAAAGLREPEAFEGLYDLYYRPILRYLHQLSGSADQAEELAQETFVKAYTGLLTFRGDSTAATWLYRIARNTYLNSVRRPAPAEIDTGALDAIPDPAPYGDPVRSHVASEQRDQIARVLARLPEEQRSIVLLRDAEGLGYTEIADVLGISVGAVRMKLFRGRNAFRQIYEQLDGAEGGDHVGL